MLISNFNFSDISLLASPELRAYGRQNCCKSYDAFSKRLFTTDFFLNTATLVKHVVCVLVDYTPLIGRICQFVREKYFGLNFTKIAREVAREAAPKIDIRISCLNGETFNINVSEIDTVRELKESIARERELHISCIELFSLFNGEAPFRASDTLASLGVIATPSIFMVLGPDNKAALEALYNSCSGPQWRKSAGWMTDPDISNWWGVTVNEDGRVRTLYLGLNNLVGTIPEKIGDLTALEELGLQRNYLKGPIPKTIANLTTLQVHYRD